MPALKNLLDRLAEMDLAKRRTWMDKFADRADTVLSGGMILLTAMEDLGLDTFVTGGKALRAGIIRDFLQREIVTTAKDRSARLVQSARTGTIPADPRAVREQNILKYARTYHYDAEHCRKTLELASWLFDGLRQVTWLGDEDRFYLQSAALLHDIGYYINPTNHHLHSQYLVLHSDLEGFHQMELRLIANLVRYHRDEEPSLDHPEYATLPEQLRKKVDLLSGMLMVADAFDFTHMGLVESLSVEVTEEKVHLHVVSSREVDLDIHEARAKCGVLERCLGRKVEITSEAKAGTPVLDVVE
jgi:exopolyphosphatase/guanosine-5'-triphosphate,3'-diphosphate pyrophosphatase